MKLQIARPHAEAMVNRFPELHPLLEQLKLGNKAVLPFHHFSAEHLGFLRTLYESAGPGMVGQAAQIATLQQALMEQGERFGEGDLERLVPAIAEFLINNAIRGWLFRANPAAKPLAYLVQRIDFLPPGEEESGRVMLDLRANAMAKIVTVTLIIRERDIIGKTVAEIIRRPLYRVHSGQLGLNVAEMEVALKNTLTRAQRWGAVMLIDEADVYIKRRDDNIAANAVVGVFLRVLEYFNGLLFLTTNRVGDIDEAIISRCIAMIRYHPPSYEDRRRIWSVMAERFGLSLSGEMLDTLAELFPEASGRDIKGLAKLTAKYCHHKSVAPTLEVFKRCSIFRGMDQAAGE